MYRQLYNLIIKSYGTAIKLAGPFNLKAQSWARGRKDIFARLNFALRDSPPVFWFHAASLGEAEQGVPIIQKIRKAYPSKKILLTFFSPSGIDNFKNEDGLADYIFYLPLDTPANAQKFLEAVKPELAFFIKYEIWPNFFREIKKQNIPLVIAPAIFRKGQFYFKAPHKNFFLPILKNVDRIMVQDANSKNILKEHGIRQVQVCGDSRFDRVKQNVKSSFENEVLEIFSENQQVLVGGSTWQPGEEILKEISKRNPSLKMIIAPHDIRPANIERVVKLFGKENTFAYSTPPQDFASKRVCVIDNIGLLSRLYRFGNIAYIGGAFGKGIHNSLEAAAYGLPLFFGPNHRHFIEPAEMIYRGFAFEIHNLEEMQLLVQRLLNNENGYLKTLGQKALKYVDEKAGAVDRIAEGVQSLL